MHTTGVEQSFGRGTCADSRVLLAFAGTSWRGKRCCVRRRGATSRAPKQARQAARRTVKHGRLIKRGDGWHKARSPTATAAALATATTSTTARPRIFVHHSVVTRGVPSQLETTARRFSSSITPTTEAAPVLGGWNLDRAATTTVTAVG